jgi:hypothetical protein
MDTIIAQYGPGITLLYIVLKELIIPLFKKIVPAKAKQLSREEDRKDKEIVFEQQMQLRTVETLEELKKNAIQQTELSRVTNDRLSLIEYTVKEIQKAVLPRKPKKVA